MPPKESKASPAPGVARPSRPSRPSTRRSTPVGTPTSTKPSGQTLSSVQPQASTSTPTTQEDTPEDWSEPPLATPKASYKEYDDKASVNTSTQHMLPLGELPSTKMVEATSRQRSGQPAKKKRGKLAASTPVPAATTPAAVSPPTAAMEASVSPANGTAIVGTGARGNGGVGVGGAGQGPLTSGGTPVPAPVAPTAPVASVRPVQTSKVKPDVSSTPVVTASSPAAPSLSRSPGINPQTPNSANGARPSTTAPSNVWINGQAPNSKTPQGRHRLEMVVDAAIERSTQIGNLGLGRAIKKLYDESLSNNLLADLLDAVLAQRATPAQEPAAEVNEANGSTSSSSATAAGIKRDKVEKEKKEKVDKKADKKDKRKNGVGRGRGAKDQENKVGEESESDLSSVLSELSDERTKPENASASVGSQPESSHSSPAIGFTPMNQLASRPKGTSERASNGPKNVPADDEVRTESNVRDPPPPSSVPRGTRATATNPRKRARSLSTASTPPPAGSNSASSNTPSTSGAASGSGSGAVGTPNMLPAQPPKKKPKGNKIKISLRVSPVKKAAAEPIVVTAGIGDLSDNRRVRYGSEEVSENEDVCAVCNGPGRFLCCERCPRSFHFTCLNPPLEEVPEGMWFCNKCTTQHNPPPKPPRGLFVDLLDNINRRNPSSFRLPSEIRNYFVGVETGPLGEYVDVRDNKTQRFGRSGFPEEYDTHRLKDKSGNIILCHSCRRSAADGQRIISCDFCPLNWHLDCVSPMPMPNPPPAQKKWMCPAHADMYQPRRPKKAVIVDAYLRRGMKNNGVIEIENEEEETFEELLISGVVYRLPERGIKLDFIEKVKNEREYAQKRRKLDTHVLGNCTPIPQTPIANLISVPIEGVPDELQATVQSLIELSTKERLSGPLDPNGLGGLVSVLIEKAPADVKALLVEKSSIPPNQPLSPAASLDTALTPNLEIEKRRLLALQELITRRIEIINCSTLPISPVVPQPHLAVAESS
ncbi:unnamed protein product [Tuber melanosporum]|uniref:(Perigord truffle) hypothetical protein n=1 Tax=Tuber melanosporum (strain Mel28) TaxID=656061 RepID=D5GHP6_TUBMM|nr:uncharacterized protein GSTUM_00008079001 [Tuber melanosporum]CAZ84076.1 unnamed protein product [Tuber melanosporum]